MVQGKEGPESRRKWSRIEQVGGGRASTPLRMWGGSRWGVGGKASTPLSMSGGSRCGVGGPHHLLGGMGGACEGGVRGHQHLSGCVGEKGVWGGTEGLITSQEAWGKLVGVGGHQHISGGEGRVRGGGTPLPSTLTVQLAKLWPSDGHAKRRPVPLSEQGDREGKRSRPPLVSDAVHEGELRH